MLETRTCGIENVDLTWTWRFDDLECVVHKYKQLFHTPSTRLSTRTASTSTSTSTRTRTQSTCTRVHIECVLGTSLHSKSVKFIHTQTQWRLCTGWARVGHV